jgi:four helix bundle protein
MNSLCRSHPPRPRLFSSLHFPKMNSLPNKERGPSLSSGLKFSTFDHERLDVYQLQLRFISWVTPLIDEAKPAHLGNPREACDQLDRASLSCLLNTAEGNGKRRGQVRALFFDDARGSATECAACLDALVAKAVLVPDKIIEGKTMLLRIVSMLCGLVNRFDQKGDQLHEVRLRYRIPRVKHLRTRTRTRTTKTAKRTWII